MFLLLLIIILTLSIILLDQITKIVVEVTLTERDYITVIKNFFYFTKSYNTGAGWSLLEEYPLILAFVSLIASAVMIYLIYKNINFFKKNKLPSIAIALALGGCIGNMIDRFLTVFKARDGVIDFLGMYIGSYTWPTYNIADVALVVGIIIFAIWALFFMDKVENSNEIVEKENEEDGDDNNA